MSGAAGLHLAQALRDAARDDGVVDLGVIVDDGLACHEAAAGCRFFPGAAGRIRQTPEFAAVAARLAAGAAIEDVIASPAFVALGMVLEAEESFCARRAA